MHAAFTTIVALLAEGVDRNITTAQLPNHCQKVALLAEGVDRNIGVNILSDTGLNVALLAEGVDRNYKGKYTPLHLTRSPSSRRAWIEIQPAKLHRWGRGCRPPRGGRG